MGGFAFIGVLGFGFVVIAAGLALGVTMGKRRRAQLDREAGRSTLPPGPAGPNWSARTSPPPGAPGAADAPGGPAGFDPAGFDPDGPLDPFTNPEPKRSRRPKRPGKREPLTPFDERHPPPAR